MLVMAFAVVTAALILGTFGAPVPVRATPTPAQSPLLSDDFTQDTALNTNLWQVNGTVGLAFATNNCPGCSNVTLTPSFSSAGMEIAAANGSSEIGTIRSIQSFAPPFTVTVEVKGTVSDGHPFVFGISNFNASVGVQITGNLNPNDCSAESNCGNPSTCGTPANASIPADQCYYGIYGRAGTSGGHWAKSPPLDPTPSVGVVYTIQIAVDSSYYAQGNVSQGGTLLGQASTQLAPGPFYIIIAQSEGAPVPGPGPNQAYWISALVTPTANIAPPSSGPSSSSSSWVYWLLLVVILIVALILLVVVRRRRGRELEVTVVESGTLAPVAGAGVSATGVKNYSGATGANGRVAFGGVRPGDYSVQAHAAGYQPSASARVPVRTSTKHTVKLESAAPHAPPSPTPPLVPSETVRPTGPTAPGSEAGATAVPPSAGPTPPPVPAEAEETEGWGGGRIREIIQTFRAQGALSPETARTADELGLSRMFVRIMKRRRGKTRVFVEVNGRYYLDEHALHEMK